MREFYEFAGNHPILTSLIVYYGCCSVVGVAQAIFKR
jgi:hypothetical protein